MSKKWYRTNIAKAILIITAHLAVMAAVAVFLWIISYPALRTEIFGREAAKEYKDTAAFSGEVESYSSHALQKIKATELFETEGKYDPDKLVDIENYSENMMNIEDSNAWGFAYRLGELVDWYKKTDGVVYDGVVSETSVAVGDTAQSRVTVEVEDQAVVEEGDTEDDTEEDIIVCEKADGGYYYYRMSEFEKLIRSGELIFAGTGYIKDMSTDDILFELRGGYALTNELYGIRNREGEVLYSDCWLYDGNKFPELYPPQGAKSILELVNKEEEWNGKLDKAYSELESVIGSIGYWYDKYAGESDQLEEGDTNYCYLYADTKNKHIFTNRKEYGAYENLEKSIEKMKDAGKYVIVLPKLADFETNMDVGASSWRDIVKYEGLTEEDFLFAAAVDTAYPIRDDFYMENELYKTYGAGARTTAVCGFVAIIVFLVCVVMLSLAAGRNTIDDEVHLNGFDRWKTEIAAALVFGVWFVILFLGIDLASVSRVVSDVGSQFTVQSDYVANSIPYIIVGAVVAAFSCGMFLIGFLSLVRRLKAKTLWKDSILRMICRFVHMVFTHLNSVWKVGLALVGFLFIQMLLFASSGFGFFIFLLLLADAAAFVWLIYQAIGRDIIKKGIENIAGGEVDYKIPLKYLKGDQKKIAEKINSIGEGLEAALEKNIKNERLKTDLITNVSHDIKTPLTSIINYVELLKQENFEDPKIQRYIEVLEAKSQRLKTLTEDVVEASKISSGNISLEYMNLNLVELVQQVSGEFEEKFQARGLKEVLLLPEGEVLIRADGRRMWRILANVYNNVAKYAMEGTRVYVDLKADGNEVNLSLKNISEQPLNISADELTERFIRGDISRSTEGSGLGLSIAKTLAEMQGGSFQLYLDGDLFRVTIAFPRVQ